MFTSQDKTLNVDICFEVVTNKRKKFALVNVLEEKQFIRMNEKGNKENSVALFILSGIV